MVPVGHSYIGLNANAGVRARRVIAKTNATQLLAVEVRQNESENGAPKVTSLGVLNELHTERAATLQGYRVRPRT